MTERKTEDVSRKEQQYCSMIRNSFKIALKDREKSKEILKKAEQLKAEIILLKEQSN